MKDKLQKVQEYILMLVVLSLPIIMIPKAHSLPLLGGNIPNAFLVIGVLLFLFYLVKFHTAIIPYKKYLIIFIGWYTLCLFIGALTYPFYDNDFFMYMRTEGIYGKLVKMKPEIFDNIILMELKYACSLFVRMIRGFFIPLVGLWLIVINLHQRDWKRGMHQISLAALILAIVMIIYSIPEMIWIWTGNETCAEILSIINPFLYDPVSTNGWWPPLLWKNQLRSMTLEPSFFGIYASFIIPLLWYRIFVENKKWCYGILIIFVFMLFASKARTGIAVYLGEMAVLFIISLLLRKRAYLKFGGKVLLVGVLSYALFIGGSTYVPAAVSGITGKSIDEMADLYIEENVTSIAGNKRSNVARNGHTVAMARIGLDYPILGVGYGYQNMYLKDRFPEFARDNHEVQNWTKDMLEKGFLKSGYPILNEYAYVFAISGVLGLILFISPIAYLGIKLLRKRQLLHNPGIFVLTVAACGQLADLLSNAFFFTYPITLSFLYLAVKSEDEKEIIE